MKTAKPSENCIHHFRFTLRRFHAIDIAKLIEIVYRRAFTSKIRFTRSLCLFSNDVNVAVRARILRFQHSLPSHGTFTMHTNCIRLSEWWEYGAKIPSNNNKKTVCMIHIEMKTNWPFIQPFSFLLFFHLDIFNG